MHRNVWRTGLTRCERVRARLHPIEGDTGVQVAKDVDNWFRASESVSSNISKAANAIGTLVPTGAMGAQHVRHITHLLLYCRDLADRVTLDLQTAIKRRQSELAHVWDMRHLALTDIAGEILKTPIDVGGSQQVSTCTNQADIQKLLTHPIGNASRVRLHSTLADFIVGMQRPLANRPSSAKEQFRRVLAELRKLHTSCDASHSTTTTLHLKHAWEQLPCVLWAAAYIDLVDQVEPPTTTADGAKRRCVPDDDSIPTPTFGTPRAEKRLK